ncbi:hypothetical protein Kpol_1027p26 [Vanderwaltozyma polyspora DSM 70294]|uniref:Rad60/SUMO-like domain-containing protein n=1 Tax=Vanderwaltozyma polyspora (strain ATCC 22028 / DSM 70294 / BCRC 21397 / CBS 2163 / NBRC 10782 / NRRL Y-8283 / UCD 57-17) TaxID=436907 RepID=A7TQN0_VANPO|nr:uncharacterized protein Kpol_1027p26 [Vanderwaltozyma polyspora DSM 70294]EDO15451.1 hypothetical protein Kpol_1027p26 [Vanderwaltozyma polyspora DSM 70294]
MTMVEISDSDEDDFFFHNHSNSESEYESEINGGTKLGDPEESNNLINSEFSDEGDEEEKDDRNSGCVNIDEAGAKEDDKLHLNNEVEVEDVSSIHEIDSYEEDTSSDKEFSVVEKNIEGSKSKRNKRWLDRTVSREEPSKRQKYEEEEENDDFSKAIRMNSNTLTNVPSPTSDMAPNRIYNITFTSKLDGSVDKKLQARVLGKQQFSEIMQPILDSYSKIYKVSRVKKRNYKTDLVTVYWDRAKLLPFMTCNSLKIPLEFQSEISHIELTIISKENEQQFEADIKAQLEVDQKENTNKTEVGSSKNFGIESQIDENKKKYEEYENELNESIPISVPSQGTAEDPMHIDGDEENAVDIIGKATTDLQQNIVKLALVGNDNKKIFVNARETTRFFKLAEYYILHRKLPKSTKVKLIFDDEQIDLDSMVKDQDVEDDDMIEVVIIK